MTPFYGTWIDTAVFLLGATVWAGALVNLWRRP